MTSAVIINILKDCGCYEYKEYFTGLKSKDDLYRFSLKELGLILPPGHAQVASKIHEYLFYRQREEFQGWIDPRHQLQYQLNLPSSSNKSQLSISSGNNVFHSQHKNTSSSSVTPGSDRRSRGERESKYESSPHIICIMDKDKKMYQCKYCDKRFTAPNQAVIHSRRHTGEKPYSCDECHKQFSQISSRNLHVRTHHQD